MEKDGTRECPEETTVGQTPAALDHKLYILKVNWRDDVRLVLGLELLPEHCRLQGLVL
jgi:hypothetical protein